MRGSFLQRSTKGRDSFLIVTVPTTFRRHRRRHRRHRRRRHISPGFFEILGVFFHSILALNGALRLILRICLSALLPRYVMIVIVITVVVVVIAGAIVIVIIIVVLGQLVNGRLKTSKCILYLRAFWLRLQ